MASTSFSTEKPSSALHRIALATATSFLCTSCAAMSSVGQARVLEADGVPCFAVSGDGATAEEMKLETLYVSELERPSKDWRSLPAELWAIDVLPPGNSVPWKSDACIRYGEGPTGTTTRTTARELERNHVYSVFVGARTKRDRGDVLGFRAAFCVTQTAEGKPAVREIAWDADAKRWRYDVCEKK